VATDMLIESVIDTRAGYGAHRTVRSWLETKPGGPGGTCNARIAHPELERVLLPRSRADRSVVLGRSLEPFFKRRYSASGTAPTAGQEVLDTMRLGV
jgi:hypothetical protein